MAQETPDMPEDDGAMEVSCININRIISEDGDMIGLSVTGGPSIIEALGMIELAKDSIMKHPHLLDGVVECEDEDD